MRVPPDLDDGTPRAALDLAGQAVRAFNHRSSARFYPGRDGWQYPSDAYRALGELTYLTGALPQVFAHIAASLRAQLEQGHIGIDHGTCYADNPAAAIEAASTALARRRAPRSAYTAGSPTRRPRSTRPATPAPTWRTDLATSTTLQRNADRLEARIATSGPNERRLDHQGS